MSLVDGEYKRFRDGVKVLLNMKAYTKDVDIKKGNVALFFSGPYCGVCKMVKPGMDRAYAACSDQFLLLEVDTSKPEALELAKGFGVAMLPTVVVLKEGQEAAKLSGGGQVSVPHILKALA